MKMPLVILIVLMAICDACAFIGFPRLTAYNAPITLVDGTPIAITVLETNTTQIITNTDFYYQAVGVGGQALGRVRTVTSSNGISRVTSAAAEISIVDNTISYVSQGTAAFTAVVSNVVTGAESGTTFTSFTSYTNAPATNNYYVDLSVGSLGHHMYTNLIARTNGRNNLLWSVFPYTIASKANFVRNPNFLLTGISNLTAISQCWEGQGPRGQLPMTALTRRHAYARGHGLGYDGVPSAGTNSNYNGMEVVFVGHDNSIVTMIITNRITFGYGSGDFTIVSFTSDLPASITPMKVGITNFFGTYTGYYPSYPTNPLAGQITGRPRPTLRTEQDGYLDTGESAAYGGPVVYQYVIGIPGFYHDSMKGGDSGSPNMLLIDNDLVMFGGRTTSAPSPTIQAMMDTLSIMSGLDPANYQMQWKDVSAFPLY